MKDALNLLSFVGNAALAGAMVSMGFYGVATFCGLMFFFSLALWM